jgi:predicted aspartyl protease
MKNLPYTGLAISLAFVIFAVAGICEQDHAETEIPFRLVNGNLIVVSLESGEDGPFNFVLDTGADTTIVDSSLAARLSLPSLRPVQQTTLAGVRILNRSLVPALSVGTAEVHNLPVLVEDLASLRQLDSHIQGIAGQDFLSHFNYLLDYRRRVLRIEAASEIENALQGDRVRIEAGGNRMIVASEGQSLRRANLRLLLDSGASSVVLIRSGSQALDVPAFESVQEATTSGNVNLRTGHVRTLSIGSERLHDISVALSAAEPAEPIGDGLLPTGLFQTLYVNNRDGFVVFNPRVKKN